MPSLIWDEGTAYDLFVSLYVLHRPATFGVRPAWAAGVRSRLPAAQRDFLEKVQSFLPVPLSWMYLLPAEAKNAAGALTTLAQLPTAERLPSLLITAETPIEVINVLNGIPLCQTWSSAEQEVLRAGFLQRGINPRPDTLLNACRAWSDLTASGEMLCEALNTYYEVFFAEEEARIRPLLKAGVEQAQEMAVRLAIPELLEALSHGVHFIQLATTREVILTPSYWSSPLVFYNRMSLNRLLVLFGIRPETQELIPGDALPQDLVDMMKAIADPTRLRILRYLSCGSQNPSELSRRLRLRAPTVIHHLNALRLVGLVEVLLQANGERVYGLRREALNNALSLLIEFITPDEIESESL